MFAPQTIALDRRSFLAAGLLLLGSLLALALSDLLSQRMGGFVVFWPANALALALLLMLSPARWWACGLALLAAHLLCALWHGQPLAPAAGRALLGLLEVGLAAWLIREHGGGADACESFNRLLVFAGSIVIAGALGASLRALVLIGQGARMSFQELWFDWFLAEVTATIALTGVLLAWFARGLDWLRGWPLRRHLEAAALLVVALFQSRLFDGAAGGPTAGFESLYLTFPLIIWAAVRFHLAGAAAVALLVGLSATWFTAQSQGPFAAFSPAENARALQTFVLVVVVTALTLGSLIRERQRGLRALAVRGEELAELAERYAAEKRRAESASAAKSAFLANISHEIRTPMTGILGMADLLGEGPLSAGQRQYLGTIRTSAEALLEIINDTLDFAKIEAGRLELARRPFALRPLVDGVVELFGQAAAAKGLALGAVVAPDLPDGLSGDPGRLRQILVNLVGNAVKFTERGGVLLEVDGAEETAGRIVLRIAATDSGIGIAPDDQARLFQRFTQVEASASKGTGLGLAICRQLTELMGGTVALESAPGAGSTFYVTLPLERASVRPGGGAPERTDAAAPPASGRVLVIDPNPLGRRLWQRHLAARGWDVQLAAGAAEGLRAAASAIDLLVFDEALPAEDQAALRDALGQGALQGAKVLLAAYGRIQGAPAPLLPHDACALKPLGHASLTQALGALAHPAGEEAEEAPAAPVEGAGRRVLLAEDNKVNQMLGFTLLSNAGHQVDLVGNGAEALEAVQAFDYQVVLMDVRMPEMDGLEATRRIRALPGSAAHLPILALTANAMAEDREACLAAGMDDHIAKPIQRDDLLDKVAHWSARRHAGGPPPEASAAAAAPGGARAPAVGRTPEPL